MKMKASITILLLIMSLILIFSSLGDAASATSQAQAPAAARTCSDMCNGRCAKAGIYKRCFNFCSICCSKCRCVPSGTYGNKSECPCYRDMLNSKGKPKCP